MKGNNRLKKAAAVFTCAAVLVTSGISTMALTQKADNTLKIASISDTHYLSPDMIKDTADYKTHLNSDRKMFTESSAILDKMLDTVREDKPDVLLISGDLTKDGELEGHRALAKKLEELKNDLPKLHVYVTNGNHDVRNSNAMNFNTADGSAIPATRTQPQDFIEAYTNVTYNDSSVFARYIPSGGEESGQLSYAARPRDGFTFIVIDSGRYSSDNTGSGRDEHETSGAVSESLEAWVLSQIKEAKLRGDTVIGMQHHGMVPHFSMEPDVLPEYLVNDYERLSQEFADAGMQYIFTGHMHANDIASTTTESGNTLYDIETGSLVTYPSPARRVDITRTVENGTVTENTNIHTLMNVGPVTFTNPLSGEEQTIADITAYGKQHGFSSDMLETVANGFLHTLYAQVIEQGGSKKALEQLIGDLLGDSLPIKDLTIEKLLSVGLPLLLPDAPDPNEKLNIYYSAPNVRVEYGFGSNANMINIPVQAMNEALGYALEKADGMLENTELLDGIVKELVNALTSMTVYDDGAQTKTLLDLVNYTYQMHLDGSDGQDPEAWVTASAGALLDGSLVDRLINVVLDQATSAVGTLAGQLNFREFSGIKGVNINDKTILALDGRTPLLNPANENTKDTLNMVILMINGALEGDYSNFDGVNAYIPEDYTLADLLGDANTILGSAGAESAFDIGGILKALINGSDGQEGLLTDELRTQLGTFAAGVITSFIHDGNYPEDNDTNITYTWALSVNPAEPTEPTDAPTDTPTDAPTDTPTDAPTDIPTDTPTDNPADAPTQNGGEGKSPGVATGDQTPAAAAIVLCALSLGCAAALGKRKRVKRVK